MALKIKIKDANRHLFLTTGYGQMSAYIAKSLTKLGHDIYYDFVTGCNDDLLDKLARKPFEHTPDTLYLWVRPPHYVKNKDFVPEHINVFYTMHETETFEGWKSDWPQLLNKCDAVVVPSEWNRKVFTNQGVLVPIYVVPLAVYTKIFHGLRTRQFSILSLHEALGKLGSRENWWDSIEVYLETFHDRNYRDVVYSIKTWNADIPSFHDHVDKFIADKGFDRSKLPPYQILEFELLPQDMNSIYGKAWLFLKNANREGWSLPLHEAMACGVKILASDIPPFREFVYPKLIDYFEVGNHAHLKERLWIQFRHWRKWKTHVNSFSPDNITKKLETVLEEVLKAHNEHKDL